MDERRYVPVLRSVQSLPKEFSKHSTIELKHARFTIGRALTNSEVIACVALSRFHCILEQDSQGQWFIKDTSRYGISVNEVIVKKEENQILRDQDVIKFDVSGDFIYKFYPNGESGACKRKHSEGDEVDNRIQEAKEKFESTQEIAIDNMKNKVLLAKRKHSDIVSERTLLEKALQENIVNLENIYRNKIKDLEGREDEVERQRVALKSKSDEEKSQLQKEINEKVTVLEKVLYEHQAHEKTLENENKALIERLSTEREEFEKRLQDAVQSKEQKLELLEKQLLEKQQELMEERKQMELLRLQEIQKHEVAKEMELKNLRNKLDAESEMRLKQIESLKLQIKMQENLTKETRVLKENEYLQQINELKKAATETEKKMINEIALRLAEYTELQEARVAAQSKFEQEKKTLERCLHEREHEKKQLQELLLQKSKQSEEDLQKFQREMLEKEAAVRLQFEKERELLVTLLSKESESCNSTVKQMQHELNAARSSSADNANLQIKTHRQSTLVIDLTGVDGPSTSYSCNPVPDTSQQNSDILGNVNRIMESELQCSICADLFIKATTLNCAHSFCKHCIETWKRKKKDCPVCRAFITSECPSIVLDSFIDKMVESLDEEAKQRRAQTLKEREEAASKTQLSLQRASHQIPQNVHHHSMFLAELTTLIAGTAERGPALQSPGTHHQIRAVLQTRTAARHRRRGRRS